MELILFGTGAPPPHKDKNGPANGIFANGKIYLVDAARNVSQQVVKAGFKLSEIDQLFFTHFHSDHYSGFGDFFISRWLTGAKKPLQVWGPPPVKKIVSKMLDYYEYDIDLRVREGTHTRAGTEIEAKSLFPGDGFDVDYMTVSVEKGTVHGNVDEILSYRFDFEEDSIVIASDGHPTEELTRLSHGTNILLAHFCVPHMYDKYGIRNSFSDLVIGHHATAEEISIVAKKAGVKTLVFSHIIPPITSNGEAFEEISKYYDGKIIAGKDLMCIET
tara:strand:+ start:124 stop:945 length:822 start_codon:yes stop_codon:yes gene_type:complete